MPNSQIATRIAEKLRTTIYRSDIPDLAAIIDAELAPVRALVYPNGKMGTWTSGKRAALQLFARSHGKQFRIVPCGVRLRLGIGGRDEQAA